MLRLYNSLSRTVEDFKPLNPPDVGVYTCGPTVYSFAHIGNFRTYTTADILLRTLKLNGYKVKYIMNLTDVGHLTGDNLGDADTGEDRMEKSARKEGKTAWEIAAFYTDAFVKDYDKLHLIRPQVFAKATDHIEEQIALIKKLEQKDYAYATSDGIYFDTSKFPNYGELSNLDEIKEGARVEVNPEKKSPKDFALWKFSYPRGVSFEEHKKEILDLSASLEASTGPIISGSRQVGARMTKDISRRHMEWDSPWGKGFPGWHIECSAMSMKYLGPTFDIHVGGVDLRETHHPNEIAQSEAATGKKFVNYWVHSAFMLVAGERMSKSLGNNYKLYDLENEVLPGSKQRIEPLALRYLYMNAHYRQEMNFTFAALEAAQNALNHLRREIEGWEKPEAVPGGRQVSLPEYEDKFKDALNNDLNTPEALSALWDMVKSDEPSGAKLASLFVMDEVLGLNLREHYEEAFKKATIAIPVEVMQLVKDREELRKNRQFNLADQLRNKIKKMGFDVKDNGKKSEVKRI